MVLNKYNIKINEHSIILHYLEKPKLYLDNLVGKKIKVRAGEPINVNIPISGAPTPNCEWSVNEKKLVETKRVLVSNKVHNEL